MIDGIGQHTWDFPIERRQLQTLTSAIFVRQVELFQLVLTSIVFNHTFDSFFRCCKILLNVDLSDKCRDMLIDSVFQSSIASFHIKALTVLACKLVDYVGF